jgi:hypothetical protein
MRNIPNPVRGAKQNHWIAPLLNKGIKVPRQITADERNLHASKLQFISQSKAPHDMARTDFDGCVRAENDIH